MAPGANSANEWYISFLANRCVEIKREISPNTPSEGYAIRIGKLLSKEVIAEREYRINAFFYDLSTSQMFGRSFHSEWIEADDNACDFNEELFFHCPQVDDKILLVFEFVERETQIVPARSIGWAKFKIQSSNDPMLDFLSSPSELFLKTFEVHTGTPKLLIFGAETTKNVIGAIEFQLFTHPKLLDVVNYFPEFFLVNEKDNIPGIRKLKNDENLHIPLKDPMISASLDEVSLVFGPDARRLEKLIIDEIVNDWNLKENLGSGIEKKTSIIERRLKIGVHNGYCYLSEPLSINLSSSNSNIISNNSLMRKRRTMSSSDLRNNSGPLFVNSRISIPNICEDPRIALIFLVEYTFCHEAEKKFSQPILIGWGAWKPFAADYQSENRHNIQATVSLVGGPRPNPEGLLCFRNLLHLHRSDDSVFTESQPQISINFSFYLDQLNLESGPPTHRTDVQVTSARSIGTPKSARKSKESTKKVTFPEPEHIAIEQVAEKDDSLPKIDTARSITSEEGLKALDEIVKYIEQPTIVPEKIRIEEPKSSVYSIPFDETKPSNFSRAIHSFFARSKFQLIKDRKGDSPTTEDVNRKVIVDFVQENYDRLEQSNIFFQFVALKQQRGQQPISKYFFTVTFYRFSELTTESLITNSTESNEPSIFTRVDKNGNQTQNMIENPGLMIKYVINSEESQDFVNYLSTGHAVIEVWNSDSLTHVGTTIIPLKNLLRCGKEAVQLFLQCPIIETSLDSERKNVAMLYLKIANVGLPAEGLYNETYRITNENDSTVVRKLKPVVNISEEGPHSYRIHAKPLQDSARQKLHRFLTAQRLDIQQRHEEIFNEESLEKVRQWNELKNNFKFDKQRVSQKFVFEEELAAYKKLRFESKPAKLLEAVFKGITTCHEIHPSFGEKLFFEFPVSNYSSEPINCTVEFDDEAISPVLDLDEWQFYKSVYKISTPLETDMMRLTSKGTEVFLKPGETIQVPFIYDSFQFPNDHFDMYSTKVVFRRWDNQEPISILDLHVYRNNHIVNHSATFITESTSNYQNQMLLPKFFRDRRIMTTRCSDPSVKSVIRNSSLQQFVTITTFSGEVGEIKSFLLMMYSDHYLSRLIAIWKITIIPHLRIDIRGIIGQTSPTNISVRRKIKDDDESDDLLRVFSNSSCLNVSTSILTDRQPAFTIEYTPNFIGTRRFVISVVNSSVSILEAAYLISASSDSPNITQKFVVNIPIDSDELTRKKIAIRNSYGISRTLRISSSRSDIVKVSDAILNIPPNSQRFCELLFVKTSHKPMNIETLLYISNADNNIQEEAYSITAKYF